MSYLDLGTFVFTRQPYDSAAPVPGGVDPVAWRVGWPYERSDIDRSGSRAVHRIQVLRRGSYPSLGDRSQL
ncbi:hypothetical protein FXF53_25710 [Micromonospora sp. WP24]|nr:hypothetical protein FXF53_25710 [Micromonospora sp. WP24]